MSTLKELEPELWSELEFGACELGDHRRTRRLVQYARQMTKSRMLPPRDRPKAGPTARPSICCSSVRK